MSRKRQTALYIRPLTLRFLLGASCLVLLLTACAPQPLTVTREPVVLRLAAADSCALLAEELVASYEEAYPWIKVQIAGTFNSALVRQTLQDSEADLALLSWLEENSEGEEPLWAQPLAPDGIAIIANPVGPFTEVGLSLLHEIFRGRVQDWEGVTLTPVSREEGSGTRAAFESAVLGGYDVTLTAVVMPSSEAVIEHVARNPGAIGYVSTLRLKPSHADRVRVLPVEGVLPTPESIANRSYYLTRPLYLATIDEPSGEVREFAQWMLGAEIPTVVGNYWR